MTLKGPHSDYKTSFKTARGNYPLLICTNNNANNNTTTNNNNNTTNNTKYISFGLNKGSKRKGSMCKIS